MRVGRFVAWCVTCLGLLTASLTGSLGTQQRLRAGLADIRNFFFGFLLAVLSKNLPHFFTSAGSLGLFVLVFSYSRGCQRDRNLSSVVE